MTAHLASQIGKLQRMFREQSVHVHGTSYRQPFPPLHTVLVGRAYYHCYDEELAALERGETPEELGLDPIEIEDEDL